MRFCFLATGKGQLHINQLLSTIQTNPPHRSSQMQIQLSLGVSADTVRVVSLPDEERPDI